MKKKKIKYKEYFDKYQKTIINKNNSIWTPSDDIILKKENINQTFFTISKYRSKKRNNFDYDTNYEFPKEEEIIKCKKVKLLLTPLQKLYLHNWFDAYAKMYNYTLRFIKNHYKQTGKTILNWKTIRTQYMKVYKDDILNRSQLKKSFEKNKSRKIKNTKIKAHCLDDAIKLACSNYKSALANLRNGHIKKFRIRYWRKNRKQKVIGLESNLFVNGSICPTLFGKIKGVYFSGNKKEDFDFNSVDSDSKIHFNSNTNEYTLLVPITKKTTNKPTKNKIISLDPGIRKFMTGISENEVIKVGKEVSGKLKKLIERKDKIMQNKDIPNKIKKKNEFLINRKINNYVTELHWKTIDYLTKNYSIILIGDMSAKQIISKNGNLEEITKRICQSMSFYKFRQRLEYKCISKNLTYRVIDERYTSKACSKCGKINEKLGSSEIFNCPNCKQIMDRDINGARGIYIKQFME